MKKNAETADELRPEYDETMLRGGVRGKYFERYQAGNNLIRLEPDVAAVFRSEQAVNAALRLLIQIASASVEGGRATE